MQFLIVDDDPDEHYILKEAANGISGDIDVSHINDSSVLMEVLRKSLPDLIYSDSHMPIKDGLECLVQLRAHQQYQSSLAVTVCSIAYNNKSLGISSERTANFFLLQPESFGTMVVLLKKVFFVSPNRLSSLSVEEFTIQ